MSEQELRKFLERLNEDPKFRERLDDDVYDALDEFELSHTERVALASSDEDALRRLAGGRLESQPVELSNWLSRHLCTRWFCGRVTRSFECEQKHG